MDTVTAMDMETTEKPMSNNPLQPNISRHGDKNSLRSWCGANRLLIASLFSIIAAPISFLEAASQLPGGKASPIQVAPLTTPIRYKLTSVEKQKLLDGTSSSAHLRALSAKAGQRIRGEPLDVEAIWSVAISNESERGKKLLGVATQLSRRELAIELYAMRAKAMSGALKESFVHLDHALVVAPSAAPAIIKQISLGLKEPGWVDLLRPYEHRSWYINLISAAAADRASRSAAAQMLINSGLTANDLPSGLLKTFIDGQVSSGNYTLAMKLAQRFSQPNVRVFSDLSLARAGQYPEIEPLIWSVTQDTTVSSHIENGFLDFILEADSSTVLLRRVTNLPQGSYKFHNDYQTSGEDVDLLWRLSCFRDGSFVQKWERALPSSISRVSFSWPMVIERDCKIQQWELHGSNAAIRARKGGRVGNLRLSRR